MIPSQMRFAILISYNNSFVITNFSAFLRRLTPSAQIIFWKTFHFWRKHLFVFKILAETPWSTRAVANNSTGRTSWKLDSYQAQKGIKRILMDFQTRF